MGFFLPLFLHSLKREKDKGFSFFLFPPSFFTLALTDSWLLFFSSHERTQTHKKVNNDRELKINPKYSGKQANKHLDARKKYIQVHQAASSYSYLLLGRTNVIMFPAKNSRIPNPIQISSQKARKSTTIFLLLFAQRFKGVMNGSKNQA